MAGAIWAVKAVRPVCAHALQVDIRVMLHAFPNPSAPRNVRLLSRTQSVLQIVWDMPSAWGGCALASYEVEAREISQSKGEGE